MKIKKKNMGRGRFAFYMRCCSKCGEHFKTKSRLRGKKLRCPKCVAKYSKKRVGGWSWSSPIIDAINEAKREK